jgi:hypothetical protein
LAQEIARLVARRQQRGSPYTLGWALWSGVVVVALVEIIPAAKDRQISRALDVYEAALRSWSIAPHSETF